MLSCTGLKIPQLGSLVAQKSLHRMVDLSWRFGEKSMNTKTALISVATAGKEMSALYF